MDGWECAGQACGGAELLERQVGLLIQQLAQLVTMVGDDDGLATRAVMLGTQVANPPALL